MRIIFSIFLLFYSFKTFATDPVFIDFSEEQKVPQVELSAAEKNKILKALFNKFYLDLKECPDDTSDVPAILSLDATRGNFSSAKSEQILVTVKAQPCNSGRAGEFSLLALFENFMLLDSSKDTGNLIAKIFPSANPGLNDAILESCGMGQGHLSCFAQTFTFQDGKIKKSDLISQTVIIDDCGTGEEKAQVKIAVFFIKDKSPLKLSFKNYSKQCDKKKFKYLSSEQLD